MRRWRLSATIATVIFVALGGPSACATSRPVLDPDAPIMASLPAEVRDLEDGRARFREIYAAIRSDHGFALPDDRPVDDALHRLPDEPSAAGATVHLGRARLPTRILFVSGVFGEYFMDALSPFPHARAHLEAYGYRTGTIVVNGRSSAEHNAIQIRDAVRRADVAPDELLVLVGYSKGAVDILTAVTEHAELRARVDAVVSVAGPIRGSPVADDLDGLTRALLEHVPVPTYPSGDGGAIESLRRPTRRAWLARHELPASIRFYSLAAFTDRDHISTIHVGTYDQLAAIDPRNDGQVICTDALIPGSTLLGFANTDHYGVALAISRDMPWLGATIAEETSFPREVLLEAIVRFVEERALASRA